jgi:hypothetical protein
VYCSSPTCSIQSPPALQTDAEREAFAALRSVELALLFWKESGAQLARAGHPNVLGARQFADTILSMLTQRDRDSG